MLLYGHAIDQVRELQSVEDAVDGWRGNRENQPPPRFEQIGASLRDCSVFVGRYMLEHGQHRDHVESADIAEVARKSAWDKPNLSQANRLAEVRIHSNSFADLRIQHSKQCSISTADIQDTCSAGNVRSRPLNSPALQDAVEEFHVPLVP
jgi:hypothetical protein